MHPTLEECRDLPGLKRIVYTSSVTTIGRPRGAEPHRPGKRPAREEDRYDLAPDPSPYFACKRMMEAAVYRAANEGLPVTIVNPTLVVDARDAHGTTARLLVPYARGRIPFYVSGGLNAIAGTDVGEGHVQAAIRGRTGQRYILGHESMTVGGFLGRVAEVAGTRPPSLRVPLAIAEPLSLATELVAMLTGARWALLPTHGLRMSRFTPEVDASLAIRELGLPQTPIRAAIRRALDWYGEEGML
jgi:dihydroflavonol-4-reductase